MTFQSIAAAAMAAVLLGAAPAPPLIVYSAPAGDRPAGADAVHPTNAILPNGRIAAPAGQSTFVGTNPLGVALSPDGKFAIVSNDDQITGGLASPAVEPPPVAGFSLSVVNTQTMTLASVYQDPSATFFMGVAALHDPADPARTLVLASDGAHGVIRTFTLDAGGQLQAEPQTIALPAQAGRRAFPAGISVTPNGRVAYVADNLGDSVTAIDIASRSVLRSIPAGDFPFDVAVGGGRVLVTASGVSSYGMLGEPARTPQFGVPAFDPARASSLGLLDLAANGDVANDPAPVPMDPAPDGTQVIGGAAPGAIAISKDGSLAFVALANVDRIAVVTLAGQPHVVRGLDLRLFPNAPYGAQPSAEVLSPDGKRLYVALAGLDSVAVLDPRAPSRYRYGLIPTAWYPSALAMSSNGRFLYVLDAKGVDGWGMLQKIDLKHTSLAKETMDALRYIRTPAPAKFDPVVPPLRSNKRSVAIDHVVCVVVGTQTYDAMLGDLSDSGGNPHGNGNAAFATYAERSTPNFHALARTYAVADNFYNADFNVDIAREYAMAGDASLYTQLTAPVNSGRTPMVGHGADPEDYMRFGYLFNGLSRAGLTYRDYGGLLQLAGFQDEAYHMDVPALAALNGNVDLNYPGYDPRVNDSNRAREFINDFKRYTDAGQMPNFTYVWLPDSRTGGVADADRALGSIVEFLSTTTHWSSTAVFVVPEGFGGGADHVNQLRGYALVVSPLARRGYVGHAHLSMASVVKTEEEIFGMPPLTLNDLLATDMADFFVDAPQPEPYQAIH